ncbi:hypothetical protein CALCODRAFT_490322 [Calocera cornea HHB12733]|uniref:Response regulatory domain-containing protein n=1 Tax=Calocera cornea HHB12733 TaxID=1353952 RepID=A0A165JQG1_9BASI|nr:hypothetical protein CALCODRAFT_490322 [Calocera cornea HHB12733]
MPYEPLPLLDSPPRTGSTSDIDDPSGAPHPELDPYAPYSSSSEEPSDREQQDRNTLDSPSPPLLQPGDIPAQGHAQAAYGQPHVSLHSRRKHSSGSNHAAMQGSDSGHSSGTTTAAPSQGPPSPGVLTTGLQGQPGPTSAPPMPAIPPLPRMTRAFSMPLPQQLRHLQHPLGRTALGSASASRSSSGFSDSGTAVSASASASPTTLSQSSSSSSLYERGSSTAQSSDSEYMRSLSLEIADSVQPIIQTLLQLSPPHILDPAKEQFSACTVQIPTASVSGLLTAMKGLNYLSARLAADGAAMDASVQGVAVGGREERLKALEAEDADEVFDIGEMLQAVGDTLAGLAAQAGVDLVLYHAEVGMLHVGVRANESAVAYLLAHVLRQVLSTAERGDTIELCLTLSNKLPRSPPRVGLGLPGSAASLSNSPTDPLSPNPVLNHAASSPSILPSSAPTPTPDTYQCVFDIVHRLHAPTLGFLGRASPHEHERGTPSLAGGVSTRLLRLLAASFYARGTEPPSLTSGGARHYVLQVPLRRGMPLLEPPLLSPDEQQSRQPFPSYQLPREPTLDELAQFVRSDLRAKRVALFASPNSAFARHVTSYLTSWGMDVVHVPTDGTEEVPALSAWGGKGGSDAVASPTMERELHEVLEGSSGSEAERVSATGSAAGSAGSAHTQANSSDSDSGPPKLSFVIIDDDVTVLRRRLVQIRKERDGLREFRLAANANAAAHANATASYSSAAARRADKLQQAGSPPQRPSLSSHHRPRSGQPRSPIGDGTTQGNSPPKGAEMPSPSPSIAGSSRTNSGGGIFDNTVIVHFTSLANFKLVRDAVQTLLALPQPLLQPQAYSPYVHPDLPEVIVIPKPAGPRRLLTALHTGLYKPLVDPFFAPIATSPLSPAAVHPLSPFFTPPGTSDHNPFGSQHGMASPVVTVPSPNLSSSPGHPPGPLNIHAMQHAHGTLYLPGGLHKARSPGPSPLAQPPATGPEGEYFPDDAVKIGSSSSSGVVLQSPDGRPAGVFFQPLARSSSNTTTAGGSTPPEGGPPPPPGPDLNGASNLGTKPLTLSTPSGESIQRQVPVGMIFSPSQVIDSYRSPSAEGPPHLPAGGAARRQPKRATTNETRPFLLPAKDRDEESGDGANGAAPNRYRQGPRRTSSAGTTGSVPAAGVPLPPSRPGSSRIPSGGSNRAAPTGTITYAPQNMHRMASRRTSGGQIVHAGSFILGEAPAPGTEIPGPVAPPSPNLAEQRPIDPDKQAQRENIRKLIQAGVEAVVPTAVRMDGSVEPEHPLTSTTVVPGAAAVASITTMPTIASANTTPSPVTGSFPSSHAPTVKPPVAAASLRRNSEATGPLPVKKKPTGDNVIVPPINVLIVEDNPINQTILMTFMRRKKIKYGTANDGAQAVDKWKTGGYHLILMDIQMPVMDGIEATKEIRRLESLANVGLFPTTPPADSLRASSPSSMKAPGTPGSLSQSSPHRSSVIIVALTASSLQSDRVAALAAGCNDFLTKPVSLKWLEKKIIEWGSIKALQMWADSAVTRVFSNGQADRTAKIRDQLRINRSGRTSPSPGPPSKKGSGKDTGTDTETPGTHAASRPSPSPAPLTGAGVKETGSGNSVTQPAADGVCAETRDDHRSLSASPSGSYFPNPPPDVFAPNDTKSLLLQDVLDDEDEDSPAETIKEASLWRRP